LLWGSTDTIFESLGRWEGCVTDNPVTLGGFVDQQPKKVSSYCRIMPATRRINVCLDDNPVGAKTKMLDVKVEAHQPL
jgi:hypothetical protein